jgi:hypothetical protein
LRAHCRRVNCSDGGGYAWASCGRVTEQRCENGGGVGKTGSARSRRVGGNHGGCEVDGGGSHRTWWTVFHLRFTVHPGRYRPQPMDRLSGSVSGRFLTPASRPHSRRRRPAKVATLWRATCMALAVAGARPRRSAL